MNQKVDQQSRPLPPPPPSTIGRTSNSLPVEVKSENPAVKAPTSASNNKPQRASGQ
ncbi:MAG: hypothetical protein RLZZ171_2569, partial [Cyanobacteriota bacterium]